MADKEPKEPKKRSLGFFGGFAVTLKQVAEPRVTTSYPEEKAAKPPRLHGRHVLNRYEDGMEKCIGCELCAAVCPADCIYVRGLDNPPDAPVSPGERYGFVYEINYLRCIHCDLCVEACPTEAITESKMFEFSFTNRSDAIYTKKELVVDDDGMPQQLAWEDWRPGEDEHSSGWMRATSPSGAVEYEGTPQWSAELGYGVRPAEGRPERQSQRHLYREHLGANRGAGQDLPPFRGQGARHMTSLLLSATIPDAITFALAAAICVVGALGVVLARNPVHSALMLVMTLFGVAVLFVEENAQFLAAVQVIVYAGAIVVLFLFVIMLLGVDRSEVIAKEPLPGQRPVAICLGILGLLEVLLLARGSWPTGARSVSGALGSPANNVRLIGQSVFTTYLLAFEVTSALLVVAVVGAVVLARRPRGAPGRTPCQKVTPQMGTR